MEQLIIYSKGLVSVSVCAVNELTPEQVEEMTNIEYPTGISSKWHISEDKTFKDGVSTNPCPCEEYPTKRKHYLLNC